MNICKECHVKETLSGRKLRKTKTSEGMRNIESY
jgi:hypothetical protein